MKYTFLIFLSVLISQMYSRNVKLATIPFDLLNSYILIETKINQTSALQLIYDSGVRNTIITELHPNDSLELKYSELRTLQGLGEGVKVDALVSQGNEVSFKGFKVNSKLVYVLKENYFRFSEQYGTKVNGFLGLDFSKDYIFEVNYNTKKIRFFNQAGFVPPQSYHAIPVKIRENKMYLQVIVEYQNRQVDTLSLLMDTGAQLNAWLSPAIKAKQSDKLKCVYGRIGEGFGGEIKGHYFKLHNFKIGDFVFKSPIVVCPDSTSVSEVLANSDRDGSIGSELLYRFNAIYNLHDSVIYLKPNKYFKKNFKYNIAGLEVIQHNLSLPQYEVVQVWKNSPAAKAGLRVGDELLYINNEAVFQMTLAQVRGYFERASRTKLKIKYSREEGIFDTKMNMIDQLK